MISILAKTLDCSVLMVSHDLHLVMSATDQVICLNGHICCHGHPEQITQDPAFLNIFGKTTAIYAHHHDHNSHDEQVEVESHQRENVCSHD